LYLDLYTAQDNNLNVMLGAAAAGKDNLKKGRLKCNSPQRRTNTLFGNSAD